MDKQELLSVLGERIVKEEKEITDVSDWINGYYCGRVDALTFAYKRVKWLDEPEKTEIPPKIAERIEGERADGQTDSAIYSILQNEKKTRMWSIAHKDDLMKAIVNGFEIQKQPVWVVRINEKLYFCRFTDKYFEKDSDAPTYIESGNPSLIKKFTNKDKAEAVAILVDGTVEEWSE